MANPYFQFKQFTVWHDRCAMKVGTDAVLLGSWMRLDGARRMLDIGCGCGLIALMAAQRNLEGEIVAVEIDEEAASQAEENIKKSPWADRIHVMKTDICTFQSEEKFDAIFSNPPYFSNALKCPDKQRTTARHTDSLSFDKLMQCAASLLKKEGEFSLVIPTEVSSALKAAAISHKLYLSRETDVFTKPGAKAKRSLLAFSPTMPKECVQPHDLIMHPHPGEDGEEYKNMVKDFYL